MIGFIGRPQPFAALAAKAGGDFSGYRFHPSPLLHLNVVTLTKHLLLALGLCLAGCATKYDQLRNYAGPDAGTVVASVGMTNENTMHFANLTIRKKGTEHLVALQFAPDAGARFGGAPVDFSDSKGRYTLRQLRLPPGEYEIYEYSSGANFGTHMVWATAPENFVIPFVVRRGETTYIGQYRVGLNVVNGKPVSSFLEVTNERQRDTSKLQVPAAVVHDEAASIVQGSLNGVRRLN